MSDDWIKAAQQGDMGAFGHLVTLWKPRILGMASRYAQGAAELDDLAQDIFIKVWKGLPKFSFQAPFEHWLLRTAVRVCYDHLRKQRRHRFYIQDMEPEEFQRRADGDGRQREPADAGPDVERLQRLMTRLKPDERLILTMLYLEDKTVAEACSLTGWGESKVKVRAMRARRKLLELWQRHDPTTKTP